MPARGGHTDLTIRAARASDRERMLALWEGAVRATHRFLAEDDIVTLRPLVADELAASAIQWWVLVAAADIPLGFLGFANDTIEALFIHPDHHGRGGGTLLISHAERLAAGPLAVDVNEQNPDARRFYEALGFKVVGRSPTDAGGRPFPLLHMKRATPTAGGASGPRSGAEGLNSSHEAPRIIPPPPRRGAPGGSDVPRRAPRRD